MDLCLSSPYRTGRQSGERRVGHGGPKSKAEAIGPNRSRAYVSGRYSRSIKATSGSADYREAEATLDVSARVRVKCGLL